ncbi:hypothetical protein Tco_0624434 [Tanacetum coccineum]|uniref:Uncharacterized protein n=1 Tax=Tanacetum coccineum TaxID=301880 RepID=A0ABQ4WE07_9ASTR
MELDGKLFYLQMSGTETSTIWVVTRADEALWVAGGGGNDVDVLGDGGDGIVGGRGVGWRWMLRRKKMRVGKIIKEKEDAKSHNYPSMYRPHDQLNGQTNRNIRQGTKPDTGQNHRERIR